MILRTQKRTLPRRLAFRPLQGGHGYDGTSSPGQGTCQREWVDNDPGDWPGHCGQWVCWVVERLIHKRLRMQVAAYLVVKIAAGVCGCHCREHCHRAFLLLISCLPCHATCPQTQGNPHPGSALHGQSLPLCQLPNEMCLQGSDQISQQWAKKGSSETERQ